MSTTQLLEQLTQLSDVERLEVIEAATRLIRKNLAAGATDSATDADRQMRVAASAVKDLYEAGSELTEWTAPDAEESADEDLQGLGAVLELS
jgi:hypothetical protein